MHLVVGIPTLNRSDPLKRCLKSLAAQNSPPEEVIIGDQNPDDTAVSVIDSMSTEFSTTTSVTVLDRPKSETLPETRNAILDSTDDDIIAFLDDDTELPPEWSLAIIDGYSHRCHPAGVGGPVVSVTPDGETAVDLLNTPRNQNRFNKYGEHKGASGRWIPPHPVETDLLPGGNMSFRTNLLEEVGGFDPDYGLNPAGEELVPSFQIRNRGESLLYHPDAQVKHYDTSYGGSEEYYSRNPEYYYWEGRHLIRSKYHYFPDTFWISVLRLLIYTEYRPPAPVWKIIGASVFKCDLQRLNWIRGYIDGLRYETDFSSLLSQD